VRAFALALSTVLGALLFACATEDNRSNWKRIDNEFFSFSVPSSFKKTNAHGIDSFAEQYIAHGIVLNFGYGPYGNQFQDWPKETKFEQLNVNGKAARIGTVTHVFYHRGIFHRSFPYSTQVYIGLDRDDSLTMFVACRSQKDIAVACKIFESIEFKETKKTRQHDEVAPNTSYSDNLWFSTL
jgi:hypothetical protein